MINDFYITGLPRTRTAWFSALFTGHEMYCFHEVLKYADEIEDIPSIINGRREFYVGASGSDFPFYFERVMSSPKAPVVVVERNIYEVRKSLRELFGDDDYELLLETNEKLEEVKNLPNVLVVDYNDLDNENQIKKIWEHCIPGIKFDRDKWIQLNTLRISIEKDKYLDFLINSVKDTIDKLK